LAEFTIKHYNITIKISHLRIFPIQTSPPP
jgi:hypothetical protein